MVLGTCSIKCANCGAQLHTLIDDWTRFGPNLLSPNSPPKNPTSWELSGISGEPRSGEFAECTLEFFRCKRCNGILGAKCLQGPIEVNLDNRLVFLENSVILRSSGMRRIIHSRVQSDSSSGNGSTPRVGHTAQMLGANLAAETISLAQFELDSTLQRGAHGFANTEYHGKIEMNDTIGGIQKQTPLLARSIDGMRRDDDVQRDDLGSIKSEMASLCKQLAEMRREQQRGSEEAKNEIMRLRNELDDAATGFRKCRVEVAMLRLQIKQLRARQAGHQFHPSLATPLPLPPSPLTIANSTRRNHRNEADSLDSLNNPQSAPEIQMIRSSGFEFDMSMTTRPQHDIVDELAGEPTALVHKTTQQSKQLSTQRLRPKRTMASRDGDSIIQTPPAKRVALSRTRSQKPVAQKKKKQQQQQRKKRDMTKPDGQSTTLAADAGQPLDGPQDNAESVDNTTYELDCILDRRFKSWFYVRWALDGSESWEPRKNIVDKQMVHDFEERHEGLDTGIDILEMKENVPGKRRYKVHWKNGRPNWPVWVDEDLLSPKCIKMIKTQESGTA